VQRSRTKAKDKHHLFSHSSTRGSTGSNERTERIKPLIKSSGHSSSNSCPTTKGAFPGFTCIERHKGLHRQRGSEKIAFMR